MAKATLVHPYAFDDFEVRVTLRDGSPWWVAADVCRVLGIRQPTRAVQHLDADDVITTHVTDALGREQETYIVSEPGLYSLILRSRKPEAKRFKRWVVAEVLPSIRSTGAYVAPSAGRDALSEVDRLASLLAQAVPPLALRVDRVAGVQQAMDTRLAEIEERHRLHDPVAVNARMVALHACKDALVTRTSGSIDPVTFRGFWSKLHQLCGVASFRHRECLTVPVLDTAVDFARRWCIERGAMVPDAVAKAFPVIRAAA